LGVRWIIGAP